ncbi:MAG: antibiotic biosynthesis monooxygenase [Chloroflexota bacterium]|nr:antibiotic biosynthesis monooxygenase [Chloroflexota bacterium]
MIVVTSRIRITSGNADAVADRYQRRSRAAETLPGCLGVEVLRHLERPDEFVVVMRRADESAYATYRRHPAFREAHARIGAIPGRLWISPDERAVDQFEVLS